MNRRIIGVIGAVVLTAGAAASCGSSENNLDRDQLIEQLTTDETIPRPQAECIADAFEREGIEVDAESNPSKADEDKATQLVIECFATDMDVDPSQIPGYQPEG